MDEYTVIYAQDVIDAMMAEVTSRHVCERIDSYRTILKTFPYHGPEYEPYYAAAKPLFPCRYTPVPGTPFALHYAVDEERREVNVFALEFQRASPMERFGR